jgi:hypothetical protein
VAAPRRAGTLVAGLGAAQLVAWGTLHYAIAVLGEPMRAELGLSGGHVFGAFAWNALVLPTLHNSAQMAECGITQGSAEHGLTLLYLFIGFLLLSPLEMCECEPNYRLQSGTCELDPCTQIPACPAGKTCVSQVVLSPGLGTSGRSRLR